jgi:hypothetical protein
MEQKLDKPEGVAAGRSIAVVGQSPTSFSSERRTVQHETVLPFRCYPVRKSFTIKENKKKKSPKEGFGERQEFEASVSRGGTPTGR